MLTPLVWRFLAAIGIIAALMLGYAKFMTNEPSDWQYVSGIGLQSKVQTGLKQMYWQWQSQGRSKTINYQPGNVDWVVVVNMNDKGLPILDGGKQGCDAFIAWFIDKRVFDSQLQMSAEFIKQDVDAPSRYLEQNKAVVGEEKRKLSFCRFVLNEQIYSYYPHTGEFTFLGANNE
jgi:hypothetical protein